MQQYLAENDEAGLEKSLSNDTYATDIFIQGNAVVYQMTFRTDLTDTQKQSLKTYIDDNMSDMSSSLKDGREESGVADMVIVCAYLAKDGSLIAGGVCDK